MSPPLVAGQGLLTLRDRAHAFVTAHGPVDEATLLAHVYGGAAPAALSARLAAPLLDDPRLIRSVEGRWALAGGGPSPDKLLDCQAAFTSLALAASGPNPSRGRIVRLAAHQVRNGAGAERFSVTVNPNSRVPRYVAARLRMSAELLDELPPFSSIVDQLVHFLDGRPILAQDAQLTWSFVLAEARRAGVVLADAVLVDVNELAIRVLGFSGKPTLAGVAARLDVGTIDVADPDEEARVLGHVGSRLLALASDQGVALPGPGTRLGDGPQPLRQAETARVLPDLPGVYVMRDTDQLPLYVGKAGRLRSRVSSYVNRPLGATRRLEGLVAAVRAVDATRCQTDLDALVLEDREIRRLQPRFNTARRQHPPRLWIRLPPIPQARHGARQLAPRRLEPSLGPSTATGDFIGPFRNETAAEEARRLARRVFHLDALRRAAPGQYEERLGQAWAFLLGESALAEALARRDARHLLPAVLAFEPGALLLPADPRLARYAVLRAVSGSLEGFLVDRGIFRCWVSVENHDASELAKRLLASSSAALTTAEDADVVLRWLGAQRPPARLVHLPDDPLAAADAIEDAVLALDDGLGEA